MINITEAYISYYRYWLSRKFLDVFGMGYLTNTFILINSVVKFEDLGDLKKLGWSNVLTDNRYPVEEIKKIFDKKIENAPKFVKVSVNELIAEASLGLSQRMHHFQLCSEMLEKFNQITDLSVMDNIYGLSELAGLYVPNFFEENLIKFFKDKPANYEYFKKVFLENKTDEIVENENIKFDFITEKCSI